MDSELRSKGIRRTVTASLLGLACMVGLVAASVPLYRLFCQVTGYGGTTQVAQSAPAIAERRITIRFDANIAKDLPWRFEPAQREMSIHLGESALAFYRVTNLSDQTVTGTATFNVTPQKTGQYFAKVECFCFSEQSLKPGETADLPVSFHVDPRLAQDATTSEVGTLTLSYTFFRAKGEPRS